MRSDKKNIQLKYDLKIGDKTAVYNINETKMQ